MSFSSEVKRELCAVKSLSPSEMAAMLYGMMFAGRTVNRRNCIQTENEELIAAATALADVVFPDSKSEIKRIVNQTNSFYTFSVKSPEVTKKFGDFTAVNPQIVSGNDSDAGAFLRGVFVSCGSVTDPKKEYHLEIVLPENNRIDLLLSFIREHGMEVKTTLRNKSTIIYAKESALIEDFLTYIGAPLHAMEIMQVKIEKDLRNRANRSVNCECANLDKTVAASEKIRRDIELIIARGEFDALSPELRETARLRLENPESSLSELCEMFTPSISRSGLNHRLKKLARIAEKIPPKNQK